MTLDEILSAHSADELEYKTRGTVMGAEWREWPRSEEAPGEVSAATYQFRRKPVAAEITDPDAIEGAVYDGALQVCHPNESTWQDWTAETFSPAWVLLKQGYRFRRRLVASPPAPGVKHAQPTAPELLAAAAKHMEERAKTYDQPGGERNMAHTVGAFNAITGRDLSESEGWLFMELLKAVRDYRTPGGHADSQEDRIAYAALGAEARRDGR